MFIKVSPGIAGMIRWLKLAISKESLQLSITCVKVENCMMTATDGFRIHRWNYRDADTEASLIQDAVAFRKLYALENGLYELNMFGIVLEANLFYSADPVAMKYPDTTKIWQSTMHKDTHFEPSFTVQLAMNPRYMREAFSVPFVNGKPVSLEFTTEFLLTYPSESHKTGGIAQALIMPMHSGYATTVAPVALQPSQNEWESVQNFRKDWHYDG